MIKLHEETNRQVITMFKEADLDLATLKAQSKEAADRAALRELGLKCQAGIVHALFDADPIISFNNNDYYIDMPDGGAVIANAPHAPAIRTFQRNRVIQMPLPISQVGDLGGHKEFISLFDLIDGVVTVVETQDDELLNKLAEIVECYREAFERINFGAEAAGIRRANARRDRVNAEVDNALADANINEEDTYWIIGWLASNITSIKAEIPNTVAARRNLEIDYPILQDVSDTDLSSYYGVNRGNAKNRWDKSTQITISKKTAMPESVKEFLETISLHRSTVDDNGLSSNVAALKLRDFGFTLGPNNPDRIKDFWHDRLRDQPEAWNNFMAGFSGIRKQEHPNNFNAEAEAEVNPLNQEFPEAL